MIRYSVDSTLTLREVHVFKNQGLHKSESYERNNSTVDGVSLNLRSKRKIKQAVSGYFLENNEVGKNVSWVTLTIPPHIWGYDYQPEIDDPRIIKQLSKFLENLRRNHGLKGYVWVAERQDGKRNNYEHYTNSIHFHCIFDFDRFVDYRSLNLYWLKLVNELGFKAFSEKAFKEKDKKGLFTVEQTFERYKKTLFVRVTPYMLKFPNIYKMVERQADKDRRECFEFLKSQDLRKWMNGLDPMNIDPNHPVTQICYNPVDVEKIKINDYRKLQTYLTKYITKNESKIYGRVWAASRSFTSVNYELIISPAEAEKIKKIKDSVIKTFDKKLEIGSQEYVNTFSKLNYEVFRKTDTYGKLLDYITTQRLNPAPSLPEFVNPEDQLQYVSSAFEILRQCSYFPNDEVRNEVHFIDPGQMPVNYNFDNEKDEFFQVVEKPKGSKQLEIEIFDIKSVDKFEKRNLWKNKLKVNLGEI